MTKRKENRMSLKETIKKRSIPFGEHNGVNFQLGNTPPRKMSEARVPGTYLGYAIVNTPEGMVEQRIDVPEGVKSVDSVYVMNQLKNPNAVRIVDEHREGDNVLKLGYGVAHSISKGFVLVTDPSSDAKFEGKPLEGNHFRILTSPNIHVDLDSEKITIEESAKTAIYENALFSKGKESR